MHPDPGADVLFERRGQAGLITLNRPGALNAVTLSMVLAMREQLSDWAADKAVERVVIRAAGDRAFSAGGDIRALYNWGKAGDGAFLEFYKQEYLLNVQIKRFPKPYIALMDGIAMGGGVGVSVNGSHRVACERMVFAMPETGIGLFPDVGASDFLPRCPGNTGLWLGLTGARLNASDALFAGLVTHTVSNARLSELTAALCETTDVSRCLDTFAESHGTNTLEALQARITRHFSATTVEGTLASLDAASDDPWAHEQARIMRAKSPTSLKITRRQLREAADLDFEACMRMEYRIVNRVFSGHDFFEGIRAVVIDKDNEPRWFPVNLEQVSDADVAAYFAPLEAELL